MASMKVSAWTAGYSFTGTYSQRTGVINITSVEEELEDEYRSVTGSEAARLVAKYQRKIEFMVHFDLVAARHYSDWASDTRYIGMVPTSFKKNSASARAAGAKWNRKAGEWQFQREAAARAFVLAYFRGER